jgi:hypothetical protein
MSSSISSSDIADVDAPAWGRWLATFLGALALGAVAIFALVLVVDPYDSGRFGILGITGVVDESPRTANASRARDPQFDSAVFGNSTGQLLKPSELSRLAGSSFVQLTVPGTGPREQLAIMDFFLRHHPRPSAIVIVTDAGWCQRDSALPLQHPFPFWLYGESTLDYAGRLFSARALGRTWRRILLAAGLRQRSAPDGYWDYEAKGPGEFQVVIASQNDTAPASAPISENFPAATLLGDALKKVPAEVPVVLVVPPALSSTLPRPGSAAAAEEDACKAALKRAIAGRPRSNLIDYRVDNALTRERANFMDVGHYRAIIARRMEQGIAESIKSGDKAKIEF